MVLVQKWPFFQLFLTFLRSTPPPAWISGVFDPPSRENFQNPNRRGGCGFFLEQPIISFSFHYNYNLLFVLIQRYQNVDLAKAKSEALEGSFKKFLSQVIQLLS